MIAVYRILFFVSMLLFIGSFILPSTHGIPISRRLSGYPDDWTLTFSTTNHLLIGVPEHQSKTMLLQYLQAHEAGDRSPLGWATLGAGVGAVFSLVGWRREDYWRKKAQKL